jgi:hypothetical protein
MSRADGLDPYVSGLPREWVERLADSDASTDALIRTTRTFHEPTLTPDISVNPPGQGPQPLPIGNVIGLHYDTPATDTGHRIFKVQRNLVYQDVDIATHTSFHIHWTKAVDTDQSGATVRWVIEYTVFDGRDDDIATPVISNTVNIDDTYDDAGTTSRIVHRSANVEVTDFIPDYYVGVKITNDAANTTLSGGPVLISADLLWRGWLNTNFLL